MRAFSGDVIALEMLLVRSMDDCQSIRDCSVDASSVEDARLLPALVDAGTTSCAVERELLSCAVEMGLLPALVDAGTTALSGCN